MSPVLQCAGLERLVTVCRKHGIYETTGPAATGVPAGGELLGDTPFDPFLGAIYRRFNWGQWDDFIVLAFDSPNESRLADNQYDWRVSPELRPFFTFGKLDSMAYYYATVPSLANAGGVQPVVYLDTYEDLKFMPVASSVDVFLDLYARYFEELIRRGQGTQCTPQGDPNPDPPEGIFSPLDLPELVAADRPLVDLLERGAFQGLAPSQPESERYIARVLAAARAAR